MKVALDTEPLIDGSSIWCFSDIFEEFSEFPQEFHGGFGLMTHSGVPKPQYYALKMLNDLAENRLDLGDGATDQEIGVAAFSGNGRIQILLFRQKIEKAGFTKKRKRLSALELNKEPYNVFLERMDEEHGNPLKLWEEWGSPEDLKPAEQEELIRRTRMEKESAEYVYENGQVVMGAELAVNDIYLFTIIE